MQFKTSRTIPEAILRQCRDAEPDAPSDPRTQVTVLKNAQGDIGGYVVQLLLMDSGAGYYDCDGEPLTSFHIFAPDEEKNAAMEIITPLMEQFPVSEALPG